MLTVTGCTRPKAVEGKLPVLLPLYLLFIIKCIKLNRSPFYVTEFSYMSLVNHHAPTVTVDVHQ